MNRELDFAYKVHCALNENLDNMPATANSRLAAARKTALSKKKPDAPLHVFVAQRKFAGQVGNLFGSRMSWLWRMGLALPLIVGGVALVSLYQIEQKHRIEETAEIDAEVLSDELPISAYLDHGFNAYLQKRDQ